jgi:hypothetical protein
MKSVVVFSFALLVFTTAPVRAQVDLVFGGKTGLNISTLAYSNEIDYELKSSFIFGPTIELKSPISQVSIQSEILFFQNGARFKDSGREIEINYIQIPLIFKYRLDTPLSDKSPVIFIGPYYNLHITTDGRIPGFFAAFMLDDLTDTPGKGALVGAEMSIKNFNIGFQTNFDFTDTFKSQYTTGEKNWSIAFIAGFKF